VSSACRGADCGSVVFEDTELGLFEPSVNVMDYERLVCLYIRSPEGVRNLGLCPSSFWLRRWIRYFCIFSERKYFWSGCSSKMSCNEHTFPVLGDSVILAVKHLPLAVVPQLINRGDDGLESPSTVMAEKSFDVFKEE
jgi:hypothetical protein